MRKKWGSYKVLGQGAGYKVKLLIVRPNSQTSRQRHKLRTEIWINMSGSSIRVIPAGQWHCLINPLNTPMQIIEVQLGICLEKDIERWKYAKK